MEDQFMIYVPSLQQTAEKFSQISSDFSDAWANLVSQAESMGDIFGDDDVGSLIGESYFAAQDVADESFTSVSDSLTDFADGLREMAQSYDQVEQDSMGRFDSMTW